MKVIEYLKETRSELKQVNWPTRQQATAFTAVVIALSLVVAFLLSFFDTIFNWLLKLIIG